MKILKAVGFCLMVVWLGATSLLIAQTETASLSGRVTDPNGAVVPHTVIEAIDNDTNIKTATETNDEGLYYMPSLRPGNYRVVVSKQGFRQIIQADVVLHVQDGLTLNFGLQVGSVSESVTVTGGAPLVNTQDAAVGTIVDRQFVANIALNGRSLQPLIELTPGVVPVATKFSNQGQFSVNGQRSNTNYFTVDGVGANVQAAMGNSINQSANGSTPALSASGGTNNLVSLDALQEFRVLTSTFAPEYGRTPGAQVSVVTRSGTNQLHGTLFDYFRNDVLDARDWFNHGPGTTKPATRQNDFGGVLGGPIIRDKTFFFFSYEGLRLRQPRFAVSDVPSLDLRQTAPTGVQPFLNAFPQPNGPDELEPCDPMTDPTCPPSGQKPNGFAPFNSSYSDPSNLNATSIRVDQKLTEKSIVFARYNYSPSDSGERTAFSGASSLNSLLTTRSTTQTLTLGHTQVFTPALNNELRFNYSRVSAGTSVALDNFGGAVVPAGSVLFPAFTSASTAQFNFGFFVGSRTTLTVGQNAANLQRQFNIVDNLSFLIGSHTLRFGADIRRLHPLVGPVRYAQSAYFFDTTTIPSGMADFVAVQADAGPREPLFTNTSIYAQDSWRISSRLTLTYGLRWDYNPPPHETTGHEAATLTGLDDPATVALAPPGAKLYKATRNNFAPRVGVAYQLMAKQSWETVLRGGFGVFYDLGNGQLGDAYRFGSFPFSSEKDLFGVPFPLSSTDATADPIATSPPVNALITVADPNLKLPYTLQWNFATEQSLGSNQVLSATYVGAAGRRLLRNQYLYNPNPSFIYLIGILRNGATSDYDALQLQYKRRLSHGVQALASYSWSHSIDDLSVDNFSLTTPPNQTTPGQDRGASDFDVRHAFSTAVTYDIPSRKTNAFGNAVLRGWSLDTIARARSATPVNLVGKRNIVGGFYYAVRPDSVLGESFYVTGQDCVAAFGEPCPGGKGFNPAAFVAPSGTAQGTLGRNVLRGFSFFQLDTTVRRQFNLTERWNLQFRADFFNILNHPNFASPDPTLSDSTFGRSISTFGQGLGGGGADGGFNPLYQSGGARSIQTSLKLQF